MQKYGGMLYLAAIDEEIVVVDSRRKRGQLSAEVSLLLPGAVYQILTPAAPHLNLKRLKKSGEKNCQVEILQKKPSRGQKMWKIQE